MLTVTIIFLIAAIVAVVAHAVYPPVPLYVSVILICVVLALTHLPK